MQAMGESASMACLFIALSLYARMKKRSIEKAYDLCFHGLIESTSILKRYEDVPKASSE